MKKILSICIPTYNRALQLDKSLESITGQEIFSKINDIEIVIYDNASIDHTSEIVDKYKKKFPSKISYYKQQNNVGASKNFKACLHATNAEYRKLSNDTNIWEAGSVEYIYSLICRFRQEKPVLFFLNGSLNHGSDILKTTGVDDFINKVSYFSTWAGSFGVWKEDLESNDDLLKYSETELPHLAFTLNRIEEHNTSYILNKKLFHTQDSPWRKRYSLGEVFGKNYLSILREHSKSISAATYNQEKLNILVKHILPYYFDARHDFFLEPLEKYLVDYWDEPYYQSVIDSARANWQRKIRNTDLNIVNSIWRRSNQHNQTRLTIQADFSLIKVGNYTYGPLNVYFWGNQKEKLIIGSFVSIADDVRFILGGNHPYKGLTTYPFKVNFCKWPTEAESKGPVIIEDDVWIGYGAMILSGVRVGQGAVIGAGAVVGKDVPPYAIVVGNPASIVRYRFNDRIIEKLKKIDLSKLPIQKFNELGTLYEELNDDNFDEICVKLFSIAN